jgi:dolichol-phosphate mannosyltransferase
MKDKNADRGAWDRRRIRALVTIPTYNERENIEIIYREVRRSARDCDILIIDDGSPDGTGDIADRLARRDRRVKVMHRTGKLGLGTANVAAIRYALENGYDALISIDADMSHPPANIPKMLERIRACDCVIGSRYVKDGGMVNWGLKRLFQSTVANTLARTLLRLTQKDVTSGFKCFRTELLARIGPERIVSVGYVYYVEILFRAVRAGARVEEIPIIFYNRDRGASKLNYKELLRFGWTLLKIRLMAWIGLV